VATFCPTAAAVLLRETLSARNIVVSRGGIEILGFQSGKVREILRSTDCSLVSYQCVSAKYEDWNAVEYCGDLAGKGFIGRHATDRGQQIYSARDSSELNDLLGLEEISFLEAGLLEPELIQKTEK